MRDTAVAILLVGGLALMLLSALGVLVMRDAFERLHYLGPAAVGALLVAIAVFVRESFSVIGDKALAIGVFLVGSGAVLAHVTARAARVRQIGDWPLEKDEPIDLEVEDP